MKVELPKSVQEVLNKFDKAGYEIYIVGGAVRDIIMGRSTNDWDFTTNATPEEILKIIPGGLYNNQFGTVFTDNPDDPARPHEVTTFRKEEGYTDARHPDKITWGKSLDEDLARRDFTINSLALDKNSKIVDLYKGADDIKQKLIRAVGDPNERFGEDALRMMRAVRIASELGFTIEDNTFEAIKKNAPLINKIAKERVKEELFKILTSPNPYEGIVLFKNSGIMQEVLPEMEKCFGVEQKSPGRRRRSHGSCSVYDLALWQTRFYRRHWFSCLWLNYPRNLQINSRNHHLAGACRIYSQYWYGCRQQHLNF